MRCHLLARLTILQYVRPSLSQDLGFVYFLVAVLDRFYGKTQFTEVFMFVCFFVVVVVFLFCFFFSFSILVCFACLYG